MSGTIHNRETSITVTNNQLSLDDFRQLTTNRKSNAGTLKVVKDANGNITGLKCAQHHSFRKLANVLGSVSANEATFLREQLKDLVTKEVTAILDRKIGHLPTKTRTAKLEKLLSLFNEDMSIDGPGHKIVPLKRTQIEKVLLKLDQLREMDTLGLVMYDAETVNRALGNAGAFTKEDKAALAKRSGKEGLDVVHGVKPALELVEAFDLAKSGLDAIKYDDDLCGQALNKLFDKLAGEGPDSLAKKQSIANEFNLDEEVKFDESGHLELKRKRRDSRLDTAMRNILNAINNPNAHKRHAAQLGVENRTETFAKECFSFFSEEPSDN